MEFCPITIDSIVDLLRGEQLTYVDTIVIGDNSSGKSLLLKQFSQRLKESKAVYFIDAVNRGFDVTKVTRIPEKPEYRKTIIDTRLQDDFFNIKDSFNCYGTLTERIEQIYAAYEIPVQQLFEELTEDTFQIQYGNTLGEVDFKNNRGLLSSGYQAMIRLLLELSYFEEMCIQKNGFEEAWVVIDELDEFLSPRYAAKIFPFLKKHFPKTRFLIATHSIDLVMTAENAHVIILDMKGYEVLDSNDYYTFSDVERIFRRLFGEVERGHTDIETALRRLMNNKINQAWSDEDEVKLQELGNCQLSASQQLIYKQILEW